MTMSVRYEPWSLRRELVNEVSRYWARNDGTEAGAGSEWAPAVDIQEYADKFVLYADVPGVEPQSIEVTLEKGLLTLSGTREKATAAEGVKVQRSERAGGRFSRRFNLPDTVDSDSVSARGTNGVLEIVIPKRPALQPRKIAVSH